MEEEVQGITLFLAISMIPIINRYKMGIIHSILDWVGFTWNSR